jgi:uncharacterized membrane-anchored protein YjiN (DUF445 family)
MDAAGWFGAGQPAPATYAAPSDAQARRALARYRAVATGLLGFMATLMLASYALPSGWPRALLESGAKAGVVGGLADWFAIVALFRHPLGIPIPHTAILPRQKARLGRALGRFVAGHVFTGAEVGRVLAQLDLPAIVARFLADPAAAKPAAAELTALLPRLLASVEDGRARRLIARLSPRLVGGPGAGRVVASVLRALVDGGRHQEVLGFVLAELRRGLETREASLKTAIEEKVRDKGGVLFGWALGAQIASRVMAAVREEMDRAGPDGSALRQAFDEWTRAEIDKLEHDPERAREIGAMLRRFAGNAVVQAWLWDVWSRLRVMLEQDALNPSGRAQHLVEGALANLGAVLAHDDKARARLQVAAESVVASLLPSAQAQLAEFIGDVVAHWDAATITRRLELSVGRDLQFVRVNGTLVGFLAGAALYAGLRLLFGSAAAF